jgi:hypothetical protein
MSDVALANEVGPPLYRLVMLELERRRRQLGISMERICEIAGTADRSFSKALYPEAANGRVAQWITLQIYADVLWPDGLDIEIRPRNGPKLTAMSMKYQIAHIAANHDRLAQRNLMRELSQKAAVARVSKIPERKRIAIARKAAKARWRKPRLVEITPPPVPTSR